MRTFYVTFSQNSPARNGFVRIEAIDERHAYNIVVEKYSYNWLAIHSAEQFDTSLYPKGELDVLK